MFYNIDTCGQFHNHFMHVSYSPSKISCAVHCMHAFMQCFQNALAFLAKVVNREPLPKKKAQCSRPPYTNRSDQLLFILKILFTFVTKQATLMRRSSVLNLPLKLVFPAVS